MSSTAPKKFITSVNKYVSDKYALKSDLTNMINDRYIFKYL